MDRLEYSNLVQKILNEYSSTSIEDEIQESEYEEQLVIDPIGHKLLFIFRFLNLIFEEQLVIDPIGHHYLLMMVGWNGERRQYESLIHLDIKDGKIWIQSDGTEVGIANELVEAGVPPEDIVLGFKSPFKRQLMANAIDS